MFSLLSLLKGECGECEDTGTDSSTDLGGGTGEGGDGGGGAHGTSGHAAGRRVGEDSGERGIGDGSVGLAGVCGAGGVRGERAAVGDTDGVELSALGGDDGAGWGALVAEEGVKRGADVFDIGVGDTERGRCKAYLLDEVSDLVLVEVHEAVDSCHGRETLVRRETGGLTAKERAEVLVQVGEEQVLVRAGAVGWHVHHERSSTTVVKEVDGDSRVATTVRGGEASIEVRKEVDNSSVVCTLGKDTWDHDANVGLGVVTNDGSVDEESQQGVLVGSSVVCQKSSGVVRADGLVRRSLRKRGDGSRKTSKDGGGTHDYGYWY